MKPTTIKTTHQKLLRNIEGGDEGTIEFGGQDYTVRTHNGRIFVDEIRVRPDKIQPMTEFTLHDTRPMRSSDLEFGDCFVWQDKGHRIRFNVKVEDGALSIWEDNTVKRHCELLPDYPVTLVDVTFDAEPRTETELKPIASGGGSVPKEFTFEGKGGKTGVWKNGWIEVWWDNAPDFWVQPDHLPVTTAVSVETTPTYDSWDDVSVGDVALHKGPCIYLGDRTWLATRDEYPPRHHKSSDFTPARLTDVTVTPRKEVQR